MSYQGRGRSDYKSRGGGGGRDSGGGRSQGKYQGYGDYGRGGQGRSQRRNDYGRGAQGRSQGRSEGRDGRGRGGGGGRTGRAPTLASNPKIALTNMISAAVIPSFQFYLYGIDVKDKSNKLVDSMSRRRELFMLAISGLSNETPGLLKRQGHDKVFIDNFMRGVFFEGSYCYSSKPIPGLNADDLPMLLLGGKEKRADNLPLSERGDILRVTGVQPYTAPQSLFRKSQQSRVSASEVRLDRVCGTCPQSFTSLEAIMDHCRITGHTPQIVNSKNLVPANHETFLSYCNCALNRALKEKLTRWGREWVQQDKPTVPKDRNGQLIGVQVFPAFSCEFGLHKTLDSNAPGALQLNLTVDLRAKIIRTKNLLDAIYEGRDPNTTKLSQSQKNAAIRTWQSEVVICNYDKKCYAVVDLLFDESAESKLIPDLGISHAEYFSKKKNIQLKYPRAKPLVALLGRQNSTIYMPAEVVFGNELDPKVRQQLPMIASFAPERRKEAIDEIKQFLIPGGRKTKRMGNLLPAIGINLSEYLITVPVEMMPLPMIIAAGVQIPERSKGFWTPFLSQANFKVAANKAIQLNVVVVYHESLSKSYLNIYERLRDIVNKFNSKYRFPVGPFAGVRVGDLEKHWGEVEKYFGSKKMPNNVFVLDFSKPPRRQSNDPAYSVVKRMLGANGYLSQFINFHTCDHSQSRDLKKSTIILQGAARQVLSKCGFRIWWISIPKSLPLPAVFVGVDVFHAPRRFDPIEKKKVGKESVAAVVVQVVRSNKPDEKIEIYTETVKRATGKELGLENVFPGIISRAMKTFNVNPMSVVIWRDGVGDPTIREVAAKEIPAIQKGLSASNVVGSSGARRKEIPLSYIICQKRIAVKFISQDGKLGMPAGAKVDSLQGSEHSTFYISGTAPPNSTPKPVRFIIVNSGGKSQKLLSELTWTFCHDYFGWAGPIKLPSTCQMAHKLAELAGSFSDGGDSLNHKAFANTLHFL